MALLKRVSEVSLLRAWGNQPFVLLWSGQTLSRIGDFVFEVALAWWVLQESGSAGAMATVLIFSMTPTVIFSLFGGVIVDRYPRVPVMISSDVLRGGTAVLISVLAFAGRLELWHVYLFSLIYGLVDAFFQPALAATVPAIVPEEDLNSANSLNSFAVQAGRILGPPLGAGLITWGGTGVAFALNGLSFFASALFLLPLMWTEIRPAPAEEAQSLWGDFREGMRTIRALPWLWVTIIIFALTNVTLAGPYSIAMPFLVSDVLKAEVKVLGLLYSMFAVGYVLGGIWLGRQPAIRRRGLFIYGGMAVAGSMLFLFGLPVGIPVLLVAALINGAVLEMGALAWTNALQSLVPREKLGRVASVDTLGSFALLPIGLGLTGLLTEAWGAAAVFMVGGGITAVLALLIYQHPAIKRLD